MPGWRPLRKDALDEGSWREGSFLHQISMNGGLLLLPNHDRVWLEAFWLMSGRPGLGWSGERELLRLLPAATVRRALWQVSFDWWLAMMSYREELALYMAERGLEGEPEIETLDRRLCLAAEQLHRLAWCSVDTDTSAIEIVRPPVR